MDDRNAPYPPRFRWLIRIGIGVAIVLVGMGVLRWTWGQVMEARLEAAVQAIRDKGEPIDLADLNPAGVPDAQNAAGYYRQAMQQWPRVNGKYITGTDWFEDPDIHSDPISDNAAYLEYARPAIDLLRQAAAAPHVDWGVRVTRPTMNMLMPHLGKSRSLARVVCDAIERAAAVGDTTLAVELTDLLLNLADDVSESPSLISYLVSISIKALAVGELADSIDAAPLNNPEHRRVTQALIARLLDGDDDQRQFIDAIHFERASMYRTFRDIADGTIGLTGNPGTPGHALKLAFLRPRVLHEAHRVMAYFNDLADAADQNSRYPPLHDLGKNHPFLQAVSEHPMLYPFSAIMLGAYDATIEAHFHSLVRQRMLAVRVAMELYERDHGEYPSKLDALLPEYLPALPEDPFAVSRDQPLRIARGSLAHNWRDGQPIEGRHDLVIYSVWRNGVDDGGEFVVASDGDIENYRESTDRVMLVATSDAASEALDDQRDVPREQRHAEDARQQQDAPDDRQQ